MMDTLDDLLDSIIITETQIAELVDEYSMYVHYLGFLVEPGKAYSSPLRIDEKPSFGIFVSTRGRVTPWEYKWKDSAMNLSGDIVDLVRHLYQLPNRTAALYQIDAEFELGLQNHTPAKPLLHVYEKPPAKTDVVLSVKTTPFTDKGKQYWEEYGVNLGLLELYKVSQVSAYWTHLSQEVPYTPRGLCFSYQIGKYYKLYQPYNPECKFLNNLPANYVEGYLQLPQKGDLLLLTKSTKDLMVLHSLGYTAVSPRSESTPFPGHLLWRLQTRFTTLVIFFDNDSTKEQNWGQLNASKYPYPSICIPDEYADKEIKDISDFRKEFGRQATINLLNQLLHDNETTGSTRN